MRNWIIEANQAENLSKQENPSQMRDFLESIGSNRRLTAGQLTMDLPHPWDFLAALRVGAQRRRSNTEWWCLYETARTHFQRNPD